jgi:hypothetical protein
LSNNHFQQLSRSQHGKNFSGKERIKLCAKSFISQVYDLLARHNPRNFALLEPMSREIANFSFEGKLKTSIEEPGQSQQELDFGSWQATISYGFPQPDGRRPPGTPDAHGAALTAQLTRA